MAPIMETSTMAEMTMLSQRPSLLAPLGGDALIQYASRVPAPEAGDVRAAMESSAMQRRLVPAHNGRDVDPQNRNASHRHQQARGLPIVRHRRVDQRG